MNPQGKTPMDAQQLRKRVLLFYFAAGVNLLMALWVGSVGAMQADGGAVTLVTLVFIGFAGLNYYMGRKLGKYLKRMLQGQAPAPAQQAGATGNEVGQKE